MPGPLRPNPVPADTTLRNPARIVANVDAFIGTLRR